MFKKFLTVALLALSLCGCGRQIVDAAVEDCTAYGYVRGTPEYAACVERGAQQRREAIRKAFQPPPGCQWSNGTGQCN